MSAEFDQLVAQFEQFQAKLQHVDEQFSGLDQMQAEIAGVEATATSADRSVTVVAGPGGSVKDIRFTEAALRQSPQALSSAVLGTLQQAVAESARKQAGIVEEHAGDGMHLMDQVLDTQAQLFGTTPEELRASMEEQPKRPARAVETEDYSEQAVLRREEPPARPAPPSSGNDPSGNRFLNLYDEEDR
ncbi:YbaB/EbfC family nucleoid-associated protein [Amycolatopsis alkalitolerans]|uniref:YbaB/EbfC family nucleoid-associated protein n=1 Tax=Amycolatopsis alkalitolerans TaxID=2547244 RepID=A0A5C4M9T1_9PSEU|nr:YbaB/EbfC family nucleoid-associated protein [Amycolatopsis alkalitolerans]TNC28679.1 YbaB/EbfC family nucleoid-associated protein [Amycolatopsis alkalitolerans]